MKIAQCLQHVPFEGPGVFRPYLEREGFQVQPYLVPTQGLPPAPEDFLLVMGGPMSVNDPDSWITQEMEFVQKAIRKNIPVVGVCLGAQLLAKATGSRVVPGPTFEIGMTPIELTQEGEQDPVFGRMPQSFEVFQWHGEGMELKPETVVLASSRAYAHQAFRLSERMYGLLFHLEMEIQGVEALCRECPADVQRGGVPVETILETSKRQLPSLHELVEKLVHHLATCP